MRITNVSGENIEIISPYLLEIKAGEHVGVRDSLRDDPMLNGLMRKGLIHIKFRTRFDRINEAD